MATGRRHLVASGCTIEAGRGPATVGGAGPCVEQPLVGTIMSIVRYQSLDPKEISATASRLQQRISDRFPKSGLAQVCAHLYHLSEAAAVRSREIDKPILWVRVASWCLITVLTPFSVFVVLKDMWLLYSILLLQNEPIDKLDAGISVLAFFGAAIIFLYRLEASIRRERALKAIHELRALAHIIDMHQLTKDPERVISPEQQLISSPKVNMSPFQLRRYLEYCNEMLSVIGKIAALYVQRLEDGIVIASSNEVESLATGLSRKIWQKIMILHSEDDGEDAAHGS